MRKSFPPFPKPLPTFQKTLKNGTGFSLVLFIDPTIVSELPYDTSPNCVAFPSEAGMPQGKVAALRLTDEV